MFRTPSVELDPVIGGVAVWPPLQPRNNPTTTSHHNHLRSLLAATATAAAAAAAAAMTTMMGSGALRPRASIGHVQAQYMAPSLLTLPLLPISPLPTPCSTTPCHVLNYIHALSSPVHIVEPPNEEKRPLLLPLFKGEC